MESVVFDLIIYNIPDKNSVNLYIDDIKSRLDLLKVKYEIVLKNENLDETVTPSVSEISEMYGGDNSIMNSLLSAIGESNVSNIEINSKSNIVYFKLFVYDDDLEKTRYFGIQQLDSWLNRKERKKSINNNNGVIMV
jgi:hypothetical protein